MAAAVEALLEEPLLHEKIIPCSFQLLLHGRYRRSSARRTIAACHYFRPPSACWPPLPPARWLPCSPPLQPTRAYHCNQLFLGPFLRASRHRYLSPPPRVRAFRSQHSRGRQFGWVEHSCEWNKYGGGTSMGSFPPRHATSTPSSPCTAVGMFGSTGIMLSSAPKNRHYPNCC